MKELCFISAVDTDWCWVCVQRGDTTTREGGLARVSSASRFNFGVVTLSDGLLGGQAVPVVPCFRIFCER